MKELPDDALPGEIAEGPDGLYYRLHWSGDWTKATKGSFVDQQQRRRREAREEARHARLPAPAAPAPPTPPPLPPVSLPPSPFAIAGPEDEENAAIYDGEYAAVLAEAAGWTRADGWTAERRVLFLERLAEHGSVRRAAAMAGVTRQAVWKLRQRAPAFRAAYEAACLQSVEILADTAIDRALHGTEEPVFQGGEQVGTRIRHHDGLLAYLLRVRDPLNHAPIDELDRWQKYRSVPAEATSTSDELAGGKRLGLPPGDRGMDPRTR